MKAEGRHYYARKKLLKIEVNCATHYLDIWRRRKKMYTPHLQAVLLVLASELRVREDTTNKEAAIAAALRKGRYLL